MIASKRLVQGKKCRKMHFATAVVISKCFGFRFGYLLSSEAYNSVSF